MTTLSITSKGQVTLKKDLLKHLGTQPGDQLDVHTLPGGRIEIVAAPKKDIGGFIGLLAGKSTKCASIDEINEAAAKGWAGRAR